MELRSPGDLECSDPSAGGRIVGIVGIEGIVVGETEDDFVDS